MNNDRLRYDSANYFSLPDGPRCLNCEVDMGLEPREGNRCDLLCTKCCGCERCDERREESLQARIAKALACGLVGR